MLMRHRRGRRSFQRDTSKLRDKSKEERTTNPKKFNLASPRIWPADPCVRALGYCRALQTVIIRSVERSKAERTQRTRVRARKG
jgi:hypothetical protein